jgi:hypothetical protein
MHINHTLRKEFTVNIRKIYILSLIFLLVIFIIFLLPYMLIWGEPFAAKFRYYISDRKYQWDSVFFYLLILRDIFSISLVIIFGAALHEILHAICWIFFTKKGIKSIKFGITSSDFSPYIHCTEPLSVRIYRIGTILPGLVLGIIPALLAIITGKFWLLMFGLFFSWAASGDYIILYMIRNLNKDILVQDHPEKIGCYIV